MVLIQSVDFIRTQLEFTYHQIHMMKMVTKTITMSYVAQIQKMMTRMVVIVMVLMIVVTMMNCVTSMMVMVRMACVV